MWNRDQVGEIRNLGFEVSGLEPASEMRRLATAANPGVDIRDGSITALPYDDGTFNVVLALEVLRYLPAVDNETAWREMLRVLRPGGTTIVTMVNRWPIDGTGCTNDSRPEGPQGAPSLSGPTVSS